MKRVPCSLTGCNFLATVPNEWLPEWPAYCTEVHRLQGEAEKAMLVKGAALAHPPSCPGCAGLGVEDSSRWGGDLELCSWSYVDGRYVSRPPGCGPWCQLNKVTHHVCRRPPERTSAPSDGECMLPPAGWRCTRGKGHDGPCAAVPVTAEQDVDGTDRGIVLYIVTFMGGLLTGAFATLIGTWLHAR